MKTIKIHPSDNVAVILEDIVKGELVTVEGFSVTAVEDIARTMLRPVSLRAASIITITKSMIFRKLLRRLSWAI